MTIGEALLLATSLLASLVGLLAILAWLIVLPTIGLLYTTGALP